MMIFMILVKIKYLSSLGSKEKKEGKNTKSDCPYLNEI